MARIKNVSGEDLIVPGLDGRLVLSGQVVEVDDDDLAVVRLRDRVDPDSGFVICVRYWSAEASGDGSQRSVRLESDGGVPPISIDDEASIEVLGRVVHISRPIASA